ncbi:3-phosphoserine/phosphohydroxythreonine transaminase [Glaciimonas immobilis]|uniref:Phosphoserine aminotransferase n=1 Tax=Glaciimonas immobilis TaxID=728004 RepID=A0A840RPK9_9BURK|nr:3-phosphoserine/phosphohydroxythreonine transaminase [Glaciimonas immobilis]KAF3999838.1 3-phosphoserine/phosphohydroxythreonine transaminase [Glaciimonas immobilis]MBB5200317.1 phosphoserine aminotransferase [Glaciimonas immobilis]
MSIYNFSAGPAVLPKEVLQQAASEMLDWHGCGMSVMEMSHRGSEFMSILAAAQRDFRELLAIPVNYKVLFVQGGAIAENAIVPLNLAARLSVDKSFGGVADYINTGSWSTKSIKEAKRYCEVNVAATSEAQHFAQIPSRADWTLSKNAAYVHICTNETIDGVEYQYTPDVAADTNGAPVVADMSSHILSRAVDVSQYGVIYAGAQKNIGPAGLTILIVRDDLLGHAMPGCPSAFDWKIIADNDSMYNTPPTYAIYIAGLVFQWLKRQGGVVAIEQRNIAKAALLYDYLDSTDFYLTKIAADCRSRMNVPFFLQDETRNEAFLAGAKQQGLLQLKGHKSVGGMRASIYNAMPHEGVETLVVYMKEFEKRHG